MGCEAIHFRQVAEWAMAAPWSRQLATHQGSTSPTCMWPHVRTVPQNSFLLSGEPCFISLKFYARISTLEQDEQDFNIANSLPLSCDPARHQGRLRCKWTERRFLSSIQSLLFTVGFSGSQVRLVDMRLVSWLEWKWINGNELACLQLDHWLKRRQWKKSWAPWVTGNQMDNT